MEYTNRKNINRGYMRLEVWQKAVELYRLVWEILANTRVDLKLRSQIADAAQSISANIAEGYSRRSISEYIQHLYIALGSMSETMTRAVGLCTTGQISAECFSRIDALHYEVENKLIRLVESLEKKRDSGGWIDRIHEELAHYDAEKPIDNEE